MILRTFQETEWSAEGGPISWVSHFIAYKEANFGDAIQSLEVTIFSNPPISKSDQGPVSKLRRRGVWQPHSVKLPSVVYQKKEKKLRIKWQSQNLTEDEMEIINSQNATNSVFVSAVQDVHNALVWGLNERLTERDDFDICGCLDWVKDAQNQAPTNDADLRSVLSFRSEMYLRNVRTKNFHERFDIDWASMHENAALLLYHPDLWNDSDARMPHGNILGKGILAHFSYYEKMSVDEILSSLGLKTYDSRMSYEEKIKALQVELSFVFAHIKKRGVVHRGLADALIRHMTVEAKNKKSFWVHRSRHGVGSHFSWMYNYLKDFTSINRPNFHQHES